MPSRGRDASADLFGQGDDDARGAAEVAEPEDGLVLRHLAEEFGAVGAQAGDGVVDVVDGEHDTMQAQRVGRRVLRLGADRRRGVVLRQLQLAVAVQGRPHRNAAGRRRVRLRASLYGMSPPRRPPLPATTRPLPDRGTVTQAPRRSAHPLRWCRPWVSYLRAPGPLLPIGARCLPDSSSSSTARTPSCLPVFGRQPWDTCLNRPPKGLLLGTTGGAT